MKKMGTIYNLTQTGNLFGISDFVYFFHKVFYIASLLYLEHPYIGNTIPKPFVFANQLGYSVSTGEGVCYCFISAVKTSLLMLKPVLLKNLPYLEVGVILPVFVF